MSILLLRLGCWGSWAFSRSNSLMSAMEMHVLDSQDEQDPPTITDTLRIILCTVLKFRLVMGDDHKGKILKYMTGYGGLTEDKTRGEAVSTGI